LIGWRTGWTMAHPRLTGLIRKVHDYLRVCAPAPFQTAGITALGLGEDFFSGLIAEYSARRKLLLDALRAAGFGFIEPEGA